MNFIGAVSWRCRCWSFRLTFFVRTDEQIIKLPEVTGTSFLGRGEQNALKFITDVHGSRLVVSDLFLVSASISSCSAMTNVHVSTSSPHHLSAKFVKIRRNCRSTLLRVNAPPVFDNLKFTESFFHHPYQVKAYDLNSIWSRISRDNIFVCTPDMHLIGGLKSMHERSRTSYPFHEHILNN